MTNQKEREREVLIRYYCRPSVSEIRKEKAQANQDGQIDHRRGTHRFGRSMRECSAKGMAAVRRSHARTHRDRSATSEMGLLVGPAER